MNWFETLTDNVKFENQYGSHPSEKASTVTY